jgi:hypothetical protein
MKQKIFPFFIALSALSVSASAAFYSVSGLSKLFVGASLAVIIMASSLEVGKLVIASLLYQYRKTLPILLKVYLTIACVVLIGITSMGIYGFLSSAYQETASRAGNVDAQVSLIETKRDNIREQLNTYLEEKESINKSVTELRLGLSNNIIQYKDKETGQIITTTSSSTRKSLEKQLDQAIERQDIINLKIDNLNSQLFQYETEIVEVTTNSGLASELGPLKYLSGLTGVAMDRIINVLLLVIIFVFDPLAISLVIAANFAFEQTSTNKKEEQKQNIIDIMKVEEAGGLDDDWDSTLNDGLEDEPALDEELTEDDKQFIVNLSQNELSEEDKKWDTNNDGMLNKKELQMKEDAMLNDPSISQWRKSKILRERKDENPNQITY